MPLLVATPAARCRAMTVCRLTVWCQPLIHGPTEMRAWQGSEEDGGAEGQHVWQTMQDRDLDQAWGGC